MARFAKVRSRGPGVAAAYKIHCNNVCMLCNSVKYIIQSNPTEVRLTKDSLIFELEVTK